MVSSLLSRHPWLLGWLAWLDLTWPGLYNNSGMKVKIQAYQRQWHHSSCPNCHLTLFCCWQVVDPVSSSLWVATHRSDRLTWLNKMNTAGSQYGPPYQQQQYHRYQPSLTPHPFYNPNQPTSSSQIPNLTPYTQLSTNTLVARRQSQGQQPSGSLAPTGELSWIIHPSKEASESAGWIRKGGINHLHFLQNGVTFYQLFYVLKDVLSVPTLQELPSTLYKFEVPKVEGTGGTATVYLLYKVSHTDLVLTPRNHKRWNLTRSSITWVQIFLRPQ